MTTEESTKSMCDWIESDELSIFLCYVSKNIEQYEQNAISFFGWSLCHKGMPAPDWKEVDRFIQEFGGELRETMNEVFPA